MGRPHSTEASSAARAAKIAKKAAKKAAKAAKKGGADAGGSRAEAGAGAGGGGGGGGGEGEVEGGGGGGDAAATHQGAVNFLSPDIVAPAATTAAAAAAAVVAGPSEVAAEGPVDDEVIGGHGRLHQAHRLGLRGDSRWAGVSLSADSSMPEVLMGLCTSGTLFVVTQPHLMRPAV